MQSFGASAPPSERCSVPSLISPCPQRRHRLFRPCNCNYDVPHSLSLSLRVNKTIELIIKGDFNTPTCAAFFSSTVIDGEVLVGCVCVCVCVCAGMWLHICTRGCCRVCRPDDPGHHDPPGEEEAGLHPRTHPDRGDLRGGPGAGSGGTDRHKTNTKAARRNLSDCKLACFVLLLGLPQAHDRVRPPHRR